MKQVLVICFLFLLFACGVYAQPVPVAIKTDEAGNFTMFRNNTPYYVKGVGGHVYMDIAQASGANSVRLWGAENAKEVLDEAHKRGLTVMLGLWMPPERHGFDYSDKWACLDQLNQFRSIVKRYKDHPALLLWGVGNEVDLFYTDFAVWDAVQNIAAMIHAEDKNHPTCVVTAGIDAPEVSLIKEKCKDIDILGVNTYGDLPALAQKIRLYGWNKPYMVTEWGPNGHWEVAKTSWLAPIEQTSTEKAITYQTRYREHILADSAICLGSYVFLWGQKQETTPTWYGVFVDNKYGECVQVLQQEWSNKTPEMAAPKIKQYLLNGMAAAASVKLAKRSKVSVLLDLEHSAKESLQYKWELMPESEYTLSGGDAERKPDALPINVNKSGNFFTFKAPSQSGPYRLFVYITDSKNQIAYGNFPFYVK
jgi:hypothetical protein